MGGSKQLTDQNPMCPAWAASGQCKANPGYMTHHCQKSCAGQAHQKQSSSQQQQQPPGANQYAGKQTNSSTNKWNQQQPPSSSSGSSGSQWQQGSKQLTDQNP